PEAAFTGATPFNGIVTPVTLTLSVYFSVIIIKMISKHSIAHTTNATCVDGTETGAIDGCLFLYATASSLKIPLYTCK
ncbi:hypothetical protein ACQWB2_26570, partial [Salmonella enterica subsp. enterica serovar Infantis]